MQSDEEPSQPLGSAPPMSAPRGSSMELLTTLMRAPLDPAYHAAAEAAAARTTGEATGATPTQRFATPAFTVVAAVLGVALGASTIHLQSYANASTRDVVRAEILDRQDTNAEIADQNAELAAEIETMREVLDPQTNRDTLQHLAAQNGTRAVRGPGIRIVIADPETSEILGESDDNAGAARVLDKDLQVVVNSLWAAGAEAVSVGDQRLTSVSAIRQAGEAILVNYTPVVGPYTVTAVGDPELLRQGFEGSIASSHLNQLREQYGISSKVTVEKSLRLPAASGVTLHEAHSTVAKSPVRE